MRSAGGKKGALSTLNNMIHTEEPSNGKNDAMEQTLISPDMPSETRMANAWKYVRGGTPGILRGAANRGELEVLQLGPKTLIITREALEAWARRVMTNSKQK